VEIPINYVVQYLNYLSSTTLNLSVHNVTDGPSYCWGWSAQLQNGFVYIFVRLGKLDDGVESSSWVATFFI